MGVILLEVLAGPRASSTLGKDPTASRVPPRSGASTALDRAAEVKDVLFGPAARNLRRAMGVETAIKRWLAAAELERIELVDIPRAEAAIAWAQRDERRGAINAARKQLKSIHAQRRVTSRHLADLTRSRAYTEGMEYIARALAERGIR